MGQGLSCRGQTDHSLFTSVQSGDLESVRNVLEKDLDLVRLTTLHDRHSALHIAAANGRIEIVSMLLDDHLVNPDSLNRHKQTPLILAAMHGKITCVEKLIQAGANILMFDSLNGRTCLHYAAFYGHSDCLQIILSAARDSHIALSWGFSRFVNIRDGKGATPLHLAARQQCSDCVHILLDSGALVCASTGGYSFPGSTPLHVAARAGSIDCIRELLAWGADRLQQDPYGRIPYVVALKHKNGVCAALLNPSSAEPLVWPSLLKFINELNQDAKALLERALMEANKEREKTILKDTGHSMSSPSHSESEGLDDNISEVSETELCCICFDQICTIEVQDCGHQMCAKCTLALCCHNKANSASIAPVCPFCRSNIVRLVAMEIKPAHQGPGPKLWESRKLMNCSEGSCSVKGLLGAPSFGKVRSHGSGRTSIDVNECINKP